jgi:hypothetical protein
MARSAPYRRWAALGASIAVASCRLDTTEPVADEPMTLVGADREGRIHLVDEGSGATTFLDSVSIQHPNAPFAYPAAIGSITSMVWVPGMDLWWVGTAPTTLCWNCIYSYEQGADTARLVRRWIEEVDTLGDFAVHPTTGRVYTFEGGFGGYLFRVDLGGVVYREVMQAIDEGAGGKGTTFTADGTLYVTGGRPAQVLTRIDITRGGTEQVGPLTYVGFPPFGNHRITVQSLVTRGSDGVVLALVLDPGGISQTPPRSFLATLDPSNAVVVHLGATSTALNALAYIPTRLLP